MTKAELQKYIYELEENNRKLLDQVADLNRQIENLTEIIRYIQKQQFGSSSEKTPRKELDGQQIMADVLNEVEASLKADEPEPAMLTKEGKIRIKSTGKKGRKETVLKSVPIEEVVHEVYGDALLCPQCGNEMKPVGKRFVRDEVQFIPAQVKIIRHMQMTYECAKCKHTDKPFIASAKAPKPLLSHSLASPSTVAEIMYQKYVNGVPLYRQEAEWASYGIYLSRSVMANWVNKCAEDYFFPLIDAMHQEMLTRDVLHCDETVVQVLKEDGKTPQSKSYVWVYRTGNDGIYPIIIYEYQPGRSGEFAKAFLGDFEGYLHTDGYSGYNKLSSVTRCGCYAHLRRKFVEAIPSKSIKAGKPSYAETGRDYLNKLFDIERKLRDLSAEERFSARLKMEKPLLTEFWAWVESFNPSKGSKLEKAVTYALNQREYLDNFLKDGRCSISNNRTEQNVKSLVIGRKNWLFCDTPNGAKASSAIYSLVETAKENGLDPRKYLTTVLTNLPQVDLAKLPDMIHLFYPWSERMQSMCKKKSKENND